MKKQLCLNCHKETEADLTVAYQEDFLCDDCIDDPCFEAIANRSRKKALFYQTVDAVTYCPQCAEGVEYDDSTPDAAEATLLSTFRQFEVDEFEITGPLNCDVCGRTVLK